jgi:hemerythrin superfamily protein
MNAVEMLKMDHEKVRRLFREYGEAGSENRGSERRDTAAQALMELEIHSKLEEEIFYPALRDRSGELKEEVDEGYDEHRQVDQMIEDLKAMDPDSEQYSERFQALMGAVEYHVAEEEAEMLPHAEQVLGQDSDRLAQQMVKRREQLVRELLPSLDKKSTM